jgi:hypothetical protein
MFCGDVGMKLKTCSALLDYWKSLRGGSALPDQSKIQPRALKKILPHVFILDGTDCDNPLYRLAGTAICDLFGLELRGCSFLANWETQSRRTVASLLHCALDSREPVFLRSVATHSGGGWTECEIVLAPLAHNGATGGRFLGAMQPIAQVPRLRYGDIVSQRLVVSDLGNGAVVKTEIKREASAQRASTGVPLGSILRPAF